MCKNSFFVFLKKFDFDPDLELPEKSDPDPDPEIIFSYPTHWSIWVSYELQHCCRIQDIRFQILHIGTQRDKFCCQICLKPSTLYPKQCDSGKSTGSPVYKFTFETGVAFAKPFM